MNVGSSTITSVPCWAGVGSGRTGDLGRSEYLFGFAVSLHHSGKQICLYRDAIRGSIDEKNKGKARGLVFQRPCLDKQSAAARQPSAGEIAPLLTWLVPRRLAGPRLGVRRVCGSRPQRARERKGELLLRAPGRAPGVLRADSQC